MSPHDPVLYAFTLGMAGLLSPCGFPLLPAYLSMFVDQPPGATTVERARGALWAGMCVSAGFLAIFGLAGGLVEAGAHVLMVWVPWAMIPLSAALVVAGALAMSGHQVLSPLPTTKVAHRRGGLTMVSFGAGYAVASLTCALPVFLAGMAGGFATSSVAIGGETVAAYVLGMSLVLTVVSVAVTFAGSAMLRSMRRWGRLVPRASGAVLCLIGLYLLYYWVSDVVDPLATSRVVEVVERVQGAISGWVTGSPRISGLALGAVLVATLLWFATHASASAGGAAASDRSVAGTRPTAGVADEKELSNG